MASWGNRHIFGMDQFYLVLEKDSSNWHLHDHGEENIRDFSQGAYTTQRTLEGDTRMPKKAADKKFQIQNNLAPVFCNRLN